MSPNALMHLTAADKALARDLLQTSPIPRDRLPYTPDFEILWAEFNRLSSRHADLPRDAFWRLLSSAAKTGGLAKRRIKR